MSGLSLALLESPLQGLQAHALSLTVEIWAKQNRQAPVPAPRPWQVAEHNRHHPAAPPPVDDLLAASGYQRGVENAGPKQRQTSPVAQRVIHSDDSHATGHKGPDDQQNQGKRNLVQRPSGLTEVAMAVGAMRLLRLVGGNDCIGVVPAAVRQRQTEDERNESGIRGLGKTITKLLHALWTLVAIQAGFLRHK
jgi:hypothetical protein